MISALKTQSKREQRLPYALILVFIILAAAIVMAGYFYYWNYAKHYQSEMQRRLSVIAELKKSDLVLWRKERMADAKVFYRNAVFSALVQRYFEKPEDAEAQSQLQAWLRKVQESDQYARVFLLDTHGSVRMSFPASPASVASILTQPISETLRSGQVTFVDFCRNEDDQRIYLAVLVPIFDGQDGKPSIGILALLIDPKQYLYPYINRWPTTDKTAETLLVRRDGNDVLFLNELKFNTNSALTVRIPLTNKDVAAVKAATGQEGIVEARDYRGVPVMADVRVIPDSPWFMVARIDTSEIYAPLRERLWLILAMVGALLTLVGLSFGLIQRQQKVRFYLMQYEIIKKMHASEKKYRQLIETLQEGIWAIDRNDNTTYVNLRMAEMLGYPIQEMQGKSMFQFMDQRGLEIAKQNMEHRRQGIKEQNDFEFLRKDGRRIYAILETSTITDEEGNFTGTLAGVIDITERKQAEAKLRERTAELFEREEDLAITLRSIGDALIATDTQGRITRMNPVAEQLTGWPLAEAAGQPLENVFRIINAQTRAPVQNPIAKVLASGQIIGLANHTALIARDGTVRQIADSAAPIRDAAGRMRGVVLAFHDVTAEYHIKEVLQKKTDELEGFFNVSLDLLCIADLEGNFIKVNKAWEDILGYPVPELEQSKFLKFVHPEDRPATLDAMAALSEGKRVLNFTNRYRHKDGSYRFIEWRSNPHGHLIYAAARDITERKQAEEALRQSKSDLEKAYSQLQDSFELESKLALEAQAASVAKGQFVANISHEIRTPLNGIIGICELLLGTRMTDEQKEYAQIINSSAESLLNIINATLDFSKIDAGKMELEKIDFNLRTIFEDIISALAVNASKKKLELIGFIEPATPLNLNGDPGRLRQIIFNLIGNAIKFTSEGEIAVMVAPVEEKDGKVYLRFAVRDTGVGVPPDKLDLLFKAFTQVDDSFTRKFGGTGLGLAIAKGLAEQMGGRIGVENNRGGGSTFWFVVPFSKQQSVTTASFEPDVFFGGQRILVVDDNETNRTILAMQLQAWGVIVATAENGEQALEKLRLAAEQEQAPFAAVITDLRMPDMDGLMLAKNIQANPEFQNIPLILMSSMILPLEIYEEHKNLFAGIILKPIRQSHLYYNLMTALSGEKSDKLAEIKEPAPEELIPPIGLRMLVVEDNVTNQKVIGGILEKMGHAAIAVANGKEALQALEMAPYDLVLMDIQMPEMDGFEAATLIRNPATRVLNHNIPILALTAHALEGDREKCLAAGMDGYIPKPVTTKILTNAIADIIAARAIKTLAKENDSQKEAGLAAFDGKSFAERLLNDKELMSETIRIFLEDTPKKIRELEKTTKDRNQEAAARVAHTIKGSAGNVSGQKLHAAAVKIETVCAAADWREAEALIPRLNRQFEMLERAMREFLKTLS